MKKFVALFLVVVMCFLLTGCGSQGAVDGKYKDLIEMLEAENYDGAIKEIEKMAENKEASKADNNNAGEDANNIKGDTRLLQFLYGEWEYKGDNPEKYSFKKLTVNKDGTCVVDGKSGTWKMVDALYGDNCLFVDIMVDEQKVAGVYLDHRSGRYIFEEVGVSVGLGESWVNTKVTTDENDIEITIDNWTDYFELVTEENYSVDSFGELERIEVVHFLALKEEYSEKVFLTDVSFKYRTTENRYSVEKVNETEKTYTLGEIVDTFKSSETVGDLYINTETGRYQMNLSYNVIYVNGVNSVCRVDNLDDIEMLRVKGNIYVEND